MTNQTNIIEITNLKIKLDRKWIHDGLNLSVTAGEIIGIVGSSGSGKTTLLREILMLQKPTSGSIKVFNQELMHASPETLLSVQRRFGVLFQQNALFSSLTALENVAFPIRERSTNLSLSIIQELALQKISAVGLPIDAANKYPAELSGGMQKRVGLARAIMLDPELLFLDEPTAGLDPNSADGLDELILTLQESLGLSIMIITHDIDSLWKITNRVAFLHEGKVLCIDKIDSLIKNPHQAIQEFFNGPRGRAVKKEYE